MKGVVELKRLVVEVLADAVDFQLAVVDDHQRMQAGHRVVVVATHFFLTDGTFPHTDADFHVLVVDPMSLFDGGRGTFAVGANHPLKVDVSGVPGVAIALFLGSTVHLCMWENGRAGVRWGRGMSIRTF